MNMKIEQERKLMKFSKNKYLNVASIFFTIMIASCSDSDDKKETPPAEVTAESCYEQEKGFDSGNKQCIAAKPNDCTAIGNKKGREYEWNDGEGKCKPKAEVTKTKLQCNKEGQGFDAQAQKCKPAVASDCDDIGQAIDGKNYVWDAGREQCVDSTAPQPEKTKLQCNKEGQGFDAQSKQCKAPVAGDCDDIGQAIDGKNYVWDADQGKCVDGSGTQTYSLKYVDRKSEVNACKAKKQAYKQKDGGHDCVDIGTIEPSNCNAIQFLDSDTTDDTDLAKDVFYITLPTETEYAGTADTSGKCKPYITCKDGKYFDGEKCETPTGKTENPTGEQCQKNVTHKLSPSMSAPNKCQTVPAGQDACGATLSTKLGREEENADAGKDAKNRKLIRWWPLLRLDGLNDKAANDDADATAAAVVTNFKQNDSKNTFKEITKLKGSGKATKFSICNIIQENDLIGATGNVVIVNEDELQEGAIGQYASKIDISGFNSEECKSKGFRFVESDKEGTSPQQQKGKCEYYTSEYNCPSGFNFSESSGQCI